MAKEEKALEKQEKPEKPVKKKDKKKSVASKTSLNLVIREQNLSKNPGVILAVVVLIAALAVAVSLLVVTLMSKVQAAQKQVDQTKSRLAAIQASYADYDEVEKEYNRYTYKGFDRSLADRLEVLSLMERDIYPVCAVRNFTVGARQMTLTLEGLTLESTSDLIATLNDEKLVQSVRVTTYDATSDTGTTYPVTDMVIVLADASAEEVEK